MTLTDKLVNYKLNRNWCLTFLTKSFAVSGNLKGKTLGRACCSKGESAGSFGSYHNIDMQDVTNSTAWNHAVRNCIISRKRQFQEVLQKRRPQNKTNRLEVCLVWTKPQEQRVFYSPHFKPLLVLNSWCSFKGIKMFTFWKLLRLYMCVREVKSMVMSAVLPKLSPCWAWRGPLFFRPSPAVPFSSPVC